MGRARQKNVAGFSTGSDHRHFLYKQYLGILSKFLPDVFIMENVKGILTSKVDGKGMFEAILRDLSNTSSALESSRKASLGCPEYTLLPIHVGLGEIRDPDRATKDPSLFVIKSELHGVPQARHRVIIMGVRKDYADKALSVPGLALAKQFVSLRQALAGLPRLRSGLSKEEDDGRNWVKHVKRQRSVVAKALGKSSVDTRRLLESLDFDESLKRSARTYAQGTSTFSAVIRNCGQVVLLNHETRGHMATDLGRYLFCAGFAQLNGRSPSSEEFPTALAPQHANWNTGNFADRFRAQLADKPASTVTSHLSKDGHAFIHWDASQCRSLTVREAARLQTFSDDYLFLGNRTQQFIQTGNAVPPMISRSIADVVWRILY